MIGSHNIPPPPSNDKVFIAAVNGEPETPLDVPTLGKEKELDGGIDTGGKELGDKDADEPNGGTLVAADTGMGGNPDIILENSTGSTPGGTGAPLASAAATISAGVGSKVPVITL